MVPALKELGVWWGPTQARVETTGQDSVGRWKNVEKWGREEESRRAPGGDDLGLSSELAEFDGSCY